jgi:hypothetical protein
MKNPHRIVLPIEFIRAKRTDAIPLMRMMAGINAMESTLRLMLRLGDEESSQSNLARLHCVTAAIGYFREIVKTLEKAKYDNRLWELVDRGLATGYALGLELSEAKKLLSHENPDIGGNVLLKLRDKVGFHWDSTPFDLYVDDSDVKEFVIWESDGPRKMDRVFQGAADAVANWFFSLSSDGENKIPMGELIPKILSAQEIVSDVVEIAVAGLFDEAGQDLTQYFVEGDTDALSDRRAAPDG